MSYTALHNNLVDIDAEDITSRWSYNISDARSEPLPPPSAHRSIVPPSPPVARPPPPKFPVWVETGVWEEDGHLKLSQEHPEVQEYLTRTREAKKQIRMPKSKVVFALAALSVIHDTNDPAHWIFWGPSFFTTGEEVDRILREESHHIKLPVAWTGTREWAPAVRSQQLKFEYVVINKKWYPYDAVSTAAASQKRRLRSSGDEAFRTGMQHFNLIENEGPSHKRGKGASKATVKKAAAAAAAARSSAPKRSTRRPAPLTAVKPKSTSKAVDRAKQASANVPSASTTTTTATTMPAPEARPISPIPMRASTRARRVVAPSDRSPRVIGTRTSPVKSSSSPVAIAEDITASLSSHEMPQVSPEPIIPDIELPAPVASVPTLTHSRKRSSSSESTETIAISDRSLSVASEDTAVASGSPPSKKRKAVAVVEPEEEIAAVAAVEVPTKRPTKRARKGVSTEDSPAVDVAQKVAAVSVGRPKSTRTRTTRTRS